MSLTATSSPVCLSLARTTVEKAPVPRAPTCGSAQMAGQSWATLGAGGRAGGEVRPHVAAAMRQQAAAARGAVNNQPQGWRSGQCDPPVCGCHCERESGGSGGGGHKAVLGRAPARLPAMAASMAFERAGLDVPQHPRRPGGSGRAPTCSYLESPTSWGPSIMSPCLVGLDPRL